MPTPQQIQQRFESLPEDVKEAISSIDTTNTILEIGKSNSIQIDEMGEFVDETSMVMLGFTKPSDFVSNIESRFGVSKEIAEKLVKEINEKILLKIRESLKKITEEKKEIEEKIDVEEIIRPKKLLEEQKSDLDEEDIFDHQKEREEMMRELEKEEETLTPTNITPQEEKPNTQLEKETEMELMEKPETEITVPNSTNQGKVDNTQTESKETPSAPEETNIIESKMKGIVKMPIEKKETAENMPQTEQQKIQNNTTDPYREPIE